MEATKFNKNKLKKFWKYPLIFINAFLDINHQIKMINNNKLLRRCIISFHECRVLKFFLIGWRIIKPKLIESNTNTFTKLISSDFYNFSKIYDLIYDKVMLLLEEQKVKFPQEYSARKYDTGEPMVGLSLLQLDENLFAKIINYLKLNIQSKTMNLYDCTINKIQIITKMLNMELFRHLDKLIINISSDEFENYTILQETINNNPNIKKLEIHLQNYGPESDENLQILLQILNSILQDVYINSDLQLNELETEFFSKAIENNNSIQKLHLTNINFSENRFKFLSEAIQNNSVLEEITLEYTDEVDLNISCCTMLGEALQNNNHLTSFSLIGKILTYNALILITNPFLINNNLTKLNLSNCGLDDEACVQLAKVLIGESIIKELNLSLNTIGENGCRFLAGGIEINSSLIKLNLSGNQINYNGLNHISKSLNNNYSLKEIDLSENNFGVEGCKELSEYLSKTRH